MVDSIVENSISHKQLFFYYVFWLQKVTTFYGDFLRIRQKEKALKMLECMLSYQRKKNGAIYDLREG